MAEGLTGLRGETLSERRDTVITKDGKGRG